MNLKGLTQWLVILMRIILFALLQMVLVDEWTEIFVWRKFWHQWKAQRYSRVAESQKKQQQRLHRRHIDTIHFKFCTKYRNRQRNARRERTKKNDDQTADTRITYTFADKQSRLYLVHCTDRSYKHLLTCNTQNYVDFCLLKCKSSDRINCPKTWLLCTILCSSHT